jgi:hypothetical protein
LWHQDIDQAINIIEGGNERIQAVELLQDNNSHILIVSVYMPTGGEPIVNEKIVYFRTVNTIDINECFSIAGPLEIAFVNELY